MNLEHSYLVSPEVAGGFGPNVVMDRDIAPLAIEHLHYVLQGWLGGEVVGSFACCLVSRRIANAIETANLSGAVFRDVEVTVDEQFVMFFPETVERLPEWVWLKPESGPNGNDFWTDENGKVAVSGSALALLQQFDVSSCEFSII